MPGGLMREVKTDAGSFYDQAEQAIFRLSSKSHWDVPIRTPAGRLHFLVAHPTPPVFDGPEDRNGKRNHDEIRLLADYVSSDTGGYIYDDRGRKGALDAEASFVIAGDLNADPHDGDSTGNSIQQLLEHPRIECASAPTSAGGAEQAVLQAGQNAEHQGDSAADTGDFGDEATGNLRLDYVLPSNDLEVTGSGVYWPKSDEPGFDLVGASDHRLVWIDVRMADAAE
jgi:endonuclease/exonuclease/phosphatase family metal-dependent hydrolase